MQRHLLQEEELIDDHQLVKFFQRIGSLGDSVTEIAGFLVIHCDPLNFAAFKQF